MTWKSALPSWVIAIDGRLEPFNVDRITERLFVAINTLGRRDPPLTRESTASVACFVAGHCMPRWI
jgi:hypothetical protein